MTATRSCLASVAAGCREPDPAKARSEARAAWHRDGLILINPGWLNSWADRRQAEILAEKLHGRRKSWTPSSQPSDDAVRDDDGGMMSAAKQHVSDRKDAPTVRDPRLWNGRWLSDDGKREVARLLRDGATNIGIERALGARRGALHKTTTAVRRALGLQTPSEIWADRQLAIIRRREAGESARTIAAGLAMNEPAVGQQLHKLFSPRKLPNLSFSEHERAEVERRLRSGESMNSIARAMHCSASMIVPFRTAEIVALVAMQKFRCACGRASGHKGDCRLHGEPLSELHRRLGEGETYAESARGLNISFSNASRRGRAILLHLRATGVRCPCGGELAHGHRCVAFPKRKSPRADGSRSGASRARLGSPLPQSTLSVLRRMYRRGTSARAIHRATGVSLTAIRSHISSWQKSVPYQSKCACGREARHPGGCAKNSIRAITPRWSRHIEQLALSGMTVRQIADRHGLGFGAVLPHTLSARVKLAEQGRACACGKAVGHPGLCSATWESVRRVRGARPVAPAIAASRRAQAIGRRAYWPHPYRGWDLGTDGAARFA